MLKHLNKKKLCVRILNSFNYPDDQLYDLSNLRIYPTQTEVNKEIQCENCLKCFGSKSNLTRHRKTPCKKPIVDLESEQVKLDEKPVSIFTENTNIITNNHIINNVSQVNNIINLNINIVKSFDDEWDVSQIDDHLKLLLLMNDSKFTKTLENILQNDINLNVLIDNTGEFGLVYKENTFEPMDIKEIVKRSMNKIYIQLNKFHQEITAENDKNNIKITNWDDEKKAIDIKYNEFITNKVIEEKVTNYIKNIYNKRKEDTLRICNEINEFNKNNSEEGY
jgi:hypothetical protein